MDIRNNKLIKVYPSDIKDGTIKIPKDIEVIGHQSFTKLSITSISIPCGVKIIENDTFFNCFNLKSVVIPESVEEIGAGAFSCCENLEHIVLPKNIKVVKSFTFNYCKGLKSVVFPSFENRQRGFHGLLGTNESGVS